jgi:hypothetical protein
MWRAHWCLGRLVGWSLILFFLREPILSALPERVAALAPADLGTWLLVVVAACVLARWSIWAYEVRKDPHGPGTPALALIGLGEATRFIRLEPMRDNPRGEDPLILRSGPGSGADASELS